MNFDFAFFKYESASSAATFWTLENLVDSCNVMKKETATDWSKESFSLIWGLKDQGILKKNLNQFQKYKREGNKKENDFKSILGAMCL